MCNHFMSLDTAVSYKEIFMLVFQSIYVRRKIEINVIRIDKYQWDNDNEITIFVWVESNLIINVQCQLNQIFKGILYIALIHQDAI